MSHWLFKTEPETWSWEMQRKRGAIGEIWSGVRNHQAKNNLAQMMLGDRGFFYHSGHEKAIVGTVEVIRTAFLDPTDPTGRFLAVTARALVSLEHPVTLARVKAEPRLSSMVLVNNTRLSVQPVTEAQWSIVCALGGIRP
jgi:predicted RNA-binding protein with PUA-like domain